MSFFIFFYFILLNFILIILFRKNINKIDDLITIYFFFFPFNMIFIVILLFNYFFPIKYNINNINSQKIKYLQKNNINIK